jgi:hypothetical protein
VAAKEKSPSSHFRRCNSQWFQRHLKTSLSCVDHFCSLYATQSHHSGEGVVAAKMKRSHCCERPPFDVAVEETCVTSTDQMSTLSCRNCRGKTFLQEGVEFRESRRRPWRSVDGSVRRGFDLCHRLLGFLRRKVESESETEKKKKYCFEYNTIKSVN